MSFRKNLIKARSHLIFLFALGCGLILVTHLENRISEDKSTEAVSHSTVSAMSVFDSIEPLPLASPQPSSSKEVGLGAIAWRYFENNTDTDTGLANSVDNYPSTTMWETGSYFVAIVSADLLGLIEPDVAEERLALALATLSNLRLYNGILPNKAYNVRTAELVDYANKPSEKGLGWSALDIARMVGTLGLVETHYPDLSGEVALVLAGWDLDRMTNNGQLIGGNIVDGVLREDQEGRVGYEQYAAKALMLYGFDAVTAYDVNETLMAKEVEGQPIPVDTRLHRNVTPAFVVSEPYLFDGLEFGFDARSHRFATAIYKAQETRFQNSGVLTAVTETHLDQSPYFIYSSVWGGGAPWAVLSFKGERLDSRRTTSTKAAFAWDALFRTEYTEKLMTTLAELGDPERGFPEGLYEIGGKPNSSVTANTNAVVLASLAFRAHGPLLHAAK